MLPYKLGEPLPFKGWGEMVKGAEEQGRQVKRKGIWQ